MMADAATLEQRLEALRGLRASGEARVRLSDGREVHYRTDAEIAAAIADLERQLRTASATPKVVYLTSSKGL
ncbi:hypothetical protein J2X65_004627 [Ancylobacter sp. 3268]|uniref:phage head-tail joining protein n=1 Tax=Ancylobacter sp. 3268 TaxID=2817752 RepID=UPI00285D2878|nr:hypothetical protein [Ancylobacter sp. 3268]MDR6955248.1 hypothetical protein [Ancylobacter sp. 3268]